MRAIFLDRNGTLNVEAADEVVDSVDKVWLVDGVLDGMKILAGLDYKLFILTNEVGLARKRFTPEEYHAINNKVLELIDPSGATITKTYVCPHEPFEGCECRKPKTGMVKQALADFPEIDLSASWVIGDRLSDVGLASAIGSHMILVDSAGKYTEATAEHVVSDFTEAARIVQTEGQEPAFQI